MIIALIDEEPHKVILPSIYITIVTTYIDRCRTPESNFLSSIALFDSSRDLQLLPWLAYGRSP